MNTIHNNMTALSEENLDEVQGGLIVTASLIAVLIGTCSGIVYVASMKSSKS